jgi:hypothetical protein
MSELVQESHGGKIFSAEGDNQQIEDEHFATRVKKYW